MKLEPYVKPKPWFFTFIPKLNTYTANSIYPYIFLPKDIYINLSTDNPNPYYVALLIHEETHYVRQKHIGVFIFTLKYLFDSKFRKKEELLAVKEAIKYLKKQGISFNFNEHERNLSNYLYLYPISKYYKYDKEKLQKVWSEVA